MCHEWKPEADFAFRSILTGVRQGHCRQCHAAYRRQHYLNNRAEYIAREAARIKSFRIENRQLLYDYLVAHPCVDCGETDVLVLEFDHRDPKTKSRDIGFLAARKPWKFVLAEIQKCDVRCANCHRKRTSEQFSWSKSRTVFRSETARLVETPPNATAIDGPSHVAGRRKCVRCGIAQPLEEYYIRDKRTGRRSTICRECSRRYGRAHYQRNRPSYLERNRVNKKKNKKRYNDSFQVRRLSYLAGRSCIDCGEADPVVLEFAHRDGTEKVADVAALIARRDWAAVELEIAKCDVRCANCHRRQTAEQFQWSRRKLQLAAVGSV
jgi:hypothetical protein